MSNRLKNLIQHINPTQPARPKAIDRADSWGCPRFLRTALARAVCSMALIAASNTAWGVKIIFGEKVDTDLALEAFAIWGDKTKDPEKRRMYLIKQLESFYDAPPEPLRPKSPAQNSSNTYHGAYQTWTDQHTTELGEPLFNGMTRTSWRLYEPTRNERVVFNTYGSNRYGVELDTVLAAYRIDTTTGATGFGLLKRVAASDNKKIPGHFSGASLLQFDAVKGQRYLIQAGSKNQGGDLLLTAFSFPQAGGLTIQPLSLYAAGGSYGYTCHLTVNYDFSGCEDTSYIVHNSTAKTLRVTAASSFGAGFTAPAPFTLAPGAVAVKTFKYNSAFDKRAVKTLSGRFTFTGKEGATVIARARMPAMVAVHGLPAEEPRLQLTAKAQVLAGATGDLFTFPVTVKNTGTVPATGCYVAPSFGATTLQATWAAYDPATGATTGPSYQPFDLKAGESKHILVAMRSFTSRLADPLNYEKPVEIGCASASANLLKPTGAFDNANVIDMTNTVGRFPVMSLVNTSPTTGRLGVPSTGRVFTASFRNDSTETAVVTAKLDDTPLFDPNTFEEARFSVAVCPGSTPAADCLQSTTRELPLSVKAGKTVTVKVALKQPANIAGFEAFSGGVSLLLTQPFSPDYFYLDVPLGGVTKALAIK